MLEGVGSALSPRGFIQPLRNPLSCLRRETSQLLVLLGGGKGGWENQTSRWKKKKSSSAAESALEILKLPQAENCQPDN